MAAALFVLMLSAAAADGTAGEQEGQHAGRLAPPADVSCDRNRLTSYSGNVTRYERSVEQTRIEITTARGSVEAFTLPHPDGRPEARYLLWGESFGAEDWPQIETAPGRLKIALQAIVWVCEDPSMPLLVDWRPSAPGGS
ncbi:MAG TPA: hypothetical protein VFG48_06905 [Xanthomonadales bacterium]|nr:hypothetical protein [Xanthomonadales bacterium]